MARPRQPIDLIILKGKKHLSKAEIEARKSSEILVDNNNVTAPSYLPTELKREFNKLAKELLNANIMSNLDVDSLARFVMARKMYVEITNELLIIDASDEKFINLLNLQDKLFKQCRSTSSDLGLTISSRCKLMIPKKEVKEPTKFEEKFGDV